MIINKATPIDWLETNADYIWKVSHNNGLPYDDYKSILPLIDRSGDIMDLDCGNGMLLRFLIKFSGHQLIPYGIDTNLGSIAQAQSEVLKEYARNISFGRIEDYDLRNNGFDILIANPFQVVDQKRKEFIEDCFESINIDGRLILFVPENTLKSRNIESLEKLDVMANFPLRYSRGDRTYFAVSDK